ncbi:hypothetical protein QFZ88_005913 [Mesorhizobium sp. YL-MeA3-2017]|uniref:DUF4336 domain-containing protein n=1 Tax=Mesorhizobium sp. YL-MeA3-2017 TaxID=3042284 RepID=UPI0015CA9A6A|nr:DUF4336 domain-containing protein [Mesorhizobium sp. YL-MeA3-2017]MDQ0333531.1 hypothetical protein [Mesorhizobium sp. YL-MeA3-2017]
MLEQVHDALWIAEGENVSFYGAPYPTRSVIARLENGDLWVWSPVRLTVDLRADVDRLGPVRHLVSPNKLHHLYLKEWKAAYPEAALWGPQSTIKKRSDLSFREPLTDNPPHDWHPDIDQAWFRGSFAMDEVVFFHRPSGTAIVADLVQTFSDRFLRKHWGWFRFLARLDGLTQDQACAPLEWRLSFINRAPARKARGKVFSWNCQRVIVAHGEWVRTGGHALLRKSFRWLGA